MASSRYYPDSRSALHEVVAALLEAVTVPDYDRLAPAYLVPHASYQTAGAVAAHVYARLLRHADQIERIVLLGPRHGDEVEGCIAPNAATWASPLGRVPIDVDTVRMLISDGHVRADDAPHHSEHSLEIQLPFIQSVVPHAKIVPLLVGPAAAQDIVLTLAALSHLSGTVVVVTSDLGEPRSAGRTLLSILEMAPQRIGSRDACGVHAVRGVLGWANHEGLRAELLAREGDHVSFAFLQTGE